MRRIMSIAAAAMAAATVFGDVAGTVINKNDERLKGQIRWSARDKAYVVTSGGVELQVKLNELQALDIPKPAGFDEAVANASKGSPTASAAAIPVLKKIVDGYKRLQWDQAAGRYLAQAYIDTGKAEQALAVCDDIIKMDSTAAYKGELAPSYWRALMALGRAAPLSSALEKAAKSGDRFSSGSALIMRGDMLMKEGNESRDAARKALVDGYLRVVLLYTDEAVAAKLQPEALFKAARCLEILSQATRADQMRSELKRAYPQSVWATAK